MYVLKPREMMHFAKHIIIGPKKYLRFLFGGLCENVFELWGKTEKCAILLLWPSCTGLCIVRGVVPVEKVSSKF